MENAVKQPLLPRRAADKSGDESDAHDRPASGLLFSHGTEDIAPIRYILRARPPDPSPCALTPDRPEKPRETRYSEHSPFIKWLLHFDDYEPNA